MKAARRVRAALLRLAPPWRRRHPVVLGTVTNAERVRLRLRTTYGPNGSPALTVNAVYAAERDPTDEAGA